MTRGFQRKATVDTPALALTQNSKTIKDSRIVSVYVEYEVACALSNGDVARDLELLSLFFYFFKPINTKPQA